MNFSLNVAYCLFAILYAICDDKPPRKSDGNPVVWIKVFLRGRADNQSPNTLER